MNDAGVAIGNEAIFTRDEVPDTGLLGMDLVRLGLERGHSAREALETILGLLEAYGQGGRAMFLSGMRYHNSFLIADCGEAFVLETSGRHWVYRRIDTAAAISNLVTIEDDWDDCSEGVTTYARQRGWWWGPSGRKLNFRAAFAVPEKQLQAKDRHDASCRYLAAARLSVADMMRHLRGHLEGDVIQIPEDPTVSQPSTVCMHPSRLNAGTAASIVIELDGQGDSAPIAWCSMGTPCTSAFVPIQVGSQLPSAVTAGYESDRGDSLWWKMRLLGELVDEDRQTLAPLVQAELNELERVWLEQTERDPSSAARLLDRRVAELWEVSQTLSHTIKCSQRLPDQTATEARLA